MKIAERSIELEKSAIEEYNKIQNTETIVGNSLFLNNKLNK